MPIFHDNFLIWTLFMRCEYEEYVFRCWCVGKVNENTSKMFDTCGSLDLDIRHSFRFFMATLGEFNTKQCFKYVVCGYFKWNAIWKYRVFSVATTFNWYFLSWLYYMEKLPSLDLIWSLLNEYTKKGRRNETEKITDLVRINSAMNQIKSI